ncbi:MAG: DUF5522 domain-containing protein [Hymenobacter sp.]
MADDPRLAAFAALPLLPGDYYLTPEGYMVFTEQYHRRRGFCCGTAAAATAPGGNRRGREEKFAQIVCPCEHVAQHARKDVTGFSLPLSYSQRIWYLAEFYRYLRPVSE